MGPPRVIGGYWRCPGRHRPGGQASMGPPRVIGGYSWTMPLWTWIPARFNGAAESNRRILNDWGNAIGVPRLQWGRRE